MIASQALSVVASLGLDIIPKDDALLRPASYIAVIANEFTQSEHEARVCLKDPGTGIRLQIPPLKPNWTAVVEEHMLAKPELREHLDCIESCFTLDFYVEVELKEMEPLVLCVQAEELQLETCPRCKERYRCVVNAKRCQASHPPGGKVPTNSSYDPDKVAAFWDDLSHDQRKELLGSGVGNEELVLKATGEKIVVVLSKGCENTHFLRLLKKPERVFKAELSKYDYAAIATHEFADALIHAYTTHQERALLDILRAEEEAQENKRKVQQEKKYARYLKRLEDRIFRPVNKGVAIKWWEDEDD